MSEKTRTDIVIRMATPEDSAVGYGLTVVVPGMGRGPVEMLCLSRLQGINARDYNPPHPRVLAESLIT